ncbi:sigma-70 family RNA polymerase sigma factor [Actinoplanes sp. KI2]|uniref:sigma-70 family RNA polymerase sigma factor n=1 Tax=Actinoplanes sp. KI2 TaxID=2983315 RepID=UPI0021D5CE6B|nr:sigma-70 family RNA polymerase sigma factor [Actinoplanes sp. KI2]MCU7730122.1 sigma-70 family RNA polymerase sigma factor [Actinoplanes sp. KI2]
MAQPSPLPDEALVAAARGGDRSAADELAHRHLPMVYHLVRQALADDPAVDDVVQDIMVRALGQLPALRSPGSFRPWLAAIAVRQIGRHLARQDLAARRTVAWDAAADRPDAGADVEGPALLRVELAGQRRQVGHATRWLGASERTSFSLWWLEMTGELTRPQVAAALGTSVAHAGVRIQRMREQLEVSRQIVAALEALPGCDLLGEVAADWDATPSPYWRKRLGRHVQSCPVCARATGVLLPTERLLAGLVLLPVPAALAAAVVAKAVAGGAAAGPGTAVASGVASWLARAVQAAAAHPLAATVTAGVLAVGVTVPTTGWTVAAPPSRTTGPAASSPSSSTALLRTGRVSLESATAAGQYVAVSGDFGVLTPVGPASDAAARERTGLRVVAGLADPSCFSFRRPDGRYLRHSSFRLRLNADDGTVLFRQDATFCPRPGFRTGSVSLESFNYRGFFLRHVNDQMWIDKYDGSAQFQADSSFFVRPPLG